MHVRTHTDRIASALIALLWLIASGSGCASARVYEGPARDPSQVSMLGLDNDRASVTLSSIDSRELKARTIEMLPGSHSAIVRVKYVQNFNSGFVKTSYTIKMQCKADFETAPGRTYVMRPVVSVLDEGFLNESITLDVRVDDEQAPGQDIATHTCWM